MRRPCTVQVVHKQAAPRTHAIAPSVQEEGRPCACRCRQAALGASGGTVPVATDPMHALRPVVISAPTVSQQSAGVSIGPAKIPIEEHMLRRHRSSHSLQWCSGVSLAWRLRASSCARAWRLDDPRPLHELLPSAAQYAWRADARGPLQRSDGSAMKWPWGSWHAVAGRLRPLSVVRSVRPLLRGPRLPHRTVARRDPAESNASAVHD